MLDFLFFCCLSRAKHCSGCKIETSYDAVVDRNINFGSTFFYAYLIDLIKLNEIPYLILKFYVNFFFVSYRVEKVWIYIYFFHQSFLKHISIFVSVIKHINPQILNSFTFYILENIVQWKNAIKHMLFHRISKKNKWQKTKLNEVSNEECICVWNIILKQAFFIWNFEYVPCIIFSDACTEYIKDVHIFCWSFWFSYRKYRLSVCLSVRVGDHSNLKSFWIHFPRAIIAVLLFTLFILFLFRNYFKSSEIWIS